MSTTPAEIWIGRGNDQLGPHAPEKIRQLVADGALRRDDLLWWDGLGEWTERDAALALLGIESVRAAPTPPPMPSRPVVRDLPRPAPVTASANSPERQRALMFMGLGLLTFAILAAAAFAFLRTPKLNLPSLGAGRGDVAEALTAAGMYKTAYAEVVMSNDQVPQSLAELGLSSAPYGALTGVRLEAGTLLFDTTRGVLALQPYRNANGQIWFRCGRSAPPAGMLPLGTIDAASATTVTEGDLPDDCR
ncbi:MAG: DUF4339 domain-containing protein [Rhodanobacteraceae bacterium]|nr:DUF4339 domain-containing protein [Rhodanobacteraceae bacterium]MBP6079624.1 DUF4339 domain-containing protein [Xanthomonadales bacterium]